MPDVVFLGDSDAPAARRAVASGAMLFRDEGEVPDASPSEASGRVLAEFLDGRLEVRLAGWPRSAAHRVGFEAIGRATARNAPLVRAAGDPPGTLLDATAGFGSDAMRFAAAGWRVVACERNPWIRWLLEEGLAEAGRRPDLAEATGRLRLSEIAESCDLMAAIEAGEAPPVDVVLLDPMYPVEGRGKRSLPPKAAQVLRALAGEDAGAAELLGSARRIARRRVIVKRPAWAAPLDSAVSFSIGSKLLRIDAYLPITSS